MKNRFKRVDKFLKISLINEISASVRPNFLPPQQTFAGPRQYVYLIYIFSKVWHLSLHFLTSWSSSSSAWRSSSSFTYFFAGLTAVWGGTTGDSKSPIIRVAQLEKGDSKRNSSCSASESNTWSQYRQRKITRKMKKLVGQLLWSRHSTRYLQMKSTSLDWFF